MRKRRTTVTFKHSGNLGDIIYSLPSVIAAGGGRMYIGDGRGALGIDRRCAKPNPMTARMVRQIIELLRLQPYLEDVRPYGNETVDYNLDRFREQRLQSVHLAACHLRAFGLKFDLARPWLHNIDPLYASDIVIGHSGRYLSEMTRLDWQALRGYEKRCVFIGFGKEHAWFKKYSKLDIEQYPVKSIVEFARVIRGSRLYIGNQSLGFALAEAMKHPRILEACCFLPNSLPQSANGYTALSRGLVRRMVSRRRT